MRSRIEPITTAIPAARQNDFRHYGVHPYFTRRPANVVREYIRTYSQLGDTVLDPFGGTGVTAVEAYLMGRNAIQNDINPFANFISSCLIDPSFSSMARLQEAYGRVEDACRADVKRIEKSAKYAKSLLNELVLPENIALPSKSDAERFYDLFTDRQLAGLAKIKRAIDLEPDLSLRNPLLLAWSASVAKLNRTFLSAKGRKSSRGGSSIFSIYRYKLAKDVVELPIWDTFEGRFRNVLKAKKEILQLRSEIQRRHPQLDMSFQVMKHDAASLDSILKPKSVDYIFTDPPYGAFISYLDLSIMWNHWLGFSVSGTDQSCETIVGGEQRLTDEHYKKSLAKSIQSCLRLLKPDRWFSVVFQHWDVSYFETILQAAADNGAELKSAVTQTGDVIWSMHKKKNSSSVLGGEMIITFYKPKDRHVVTRKQNLTPSESSEDLLDHVLDALLDQGASEFSHEVLFNKMVIEFWKRDAMSCLELNRHLFAEKLQQRGWEYISKKHHWIKKDGSLESKVQPSLFP
jgi:adenine-specific DNA methylase